MIPTRPKASVFRTAANIAAAKAAAAAAQAEASQGAVGASSKLGVVTPKVAAAKKAAAKAKAETSPAAADASSGLGPAPPAYPVEGLRVFVLLEDGECVGALTLANAPAQALSDATWMAAQAVGFSVWRHDVSYNISDGTAPHVAGSDAEEAVIALMRQHGYIDLTMAAASIKENPNSMIGWGAAPNRRLLQRACALSLVACESYRSSRTVAIEDAEVGVVQVGDLISEPEEYGPILWLEALPSAPAGAGRPSADSAMPSASGGAGPSAVEPAQSSRMLPPPPLPLSTLRPHAPLLPVPPPAPPPPPPGAAYISANSGESTGPVIRSGSVSLTPAPHTEAPTAKRGPRTTATPPWRTEAAGPAV